MTAMFNLKLQIVRIFKLDIKCEERISLKRII